MNLLYFISYIYNEMFKKTIGDYSTEHVSKDNNIIHKTIQYMDDSNNVFSSNDVKYLQPYDYKYFKLLIG